MTTKFTFVATVTAFSVLSSTVFADTVRVAIAQEPWPPFSMITPSGDWTGWEIEVIHAVCAVSDLSCEIVPVPWENIIPALVEGEVDAIMGSLSITEEREQIIDFSDHYYKSPTVLVAGRVLDVEPSVDAMTGLVIGVQTETTNQAYVQKHYGSVVADIQTFPTQDEANQALVMGLIDAVIAENTAMVSFLENEGSTCCEVKGQIPDDPEVLGRGIGAGVRQGDDALREAINAGIAEILANGTHDEITSRYFDASIYSE